MPRPVKRTEVIADVKRLYQDLDRIPRAKDLESEGNHSLYTYYKHFDGIEELLEAAGLSWEEPNRNRYKREELLTEIDRLADGNVPPTSAEMNARGKYSVSTYQSRFGGWNDALEVAGYEPHCLIDINPDALLDDLQTVAKDLGRTPTREEYVANGQHSAEPFKRAFGGHQGALRAAGLPIPKRQAVSSEELVVELVAVADDLGHPPSFDEMGDRYAYHPSIYTKRFGSWNDALEAAGLEGSSPPEKVPDDELLAEVAMVIETLGHPPTQSELTEIGSYSMMPYNRAFGGINAAVREIGHEPRNPWGEDKGGQYYGPNWQEQRLRCLARDGYQCQVCELDRDSHYQRFEHDLSAHHIERFDSFDSYEVANRLENLVTVCAGCHGSVEGKPRSFFGL